MNVKVGTVVNRRVMTEADWAKEEAEADKELATTAEPVETPSPAAAPGNPDAPAIPEPPPAPEPTPTPAPEPQEPEQTPAPQPQELDVLKQEMAAKQAKIDELTKRMRDDAGRYGGELSELKRMIAELKEMRAATPAASSAPVEPEPEPLADYDENVREGVRKIAKAEIKAVTEELAKTKAEIAAERERSVQSDFARYVERVKAEAPAASELNNDPTFNEWLDSTKAGTGRRTLRQELDECNTVRDHETAIAIVRRYESEHPKAAATPVETPRGPVKPSKEAQVAVPSAAGATPPRQTGPTMARLKHLEAKTLNNTATKDEYDEFYRLSDAADRGELK